VCHVREHSPWVVVHERRPIATSGRAASSRNELSRSSHERLGVLPKIDSPEKSFPDPKTVPASDIHPVLCHNQNVSSRRVEAALIVLAGTLAAAVWLLTYRVWDVTEYVEYIGGKRHYFHAPEHVRVTPWWSVPATVAVLLAGSGLSLWLLPGSRGLIKRLADHFAKLSERDTEGRASGPAGG
jgi:hypothetical protein